jgi:hypothetical protein
MPLGEMDESIDIRVVRKLANNEFHLKLAAKASLL